VGNLKFWIAEEKNRTNSESRERKKKDRNLLLRKQIERERKR
jgi:hypothetical protein